MQDMTGAWHWRRSDADQRVHAFRDDEGIGFFVEAACAYTVPGSKIKRTHEGARCVSCLLIVGDQLAQRLDGTPGR
jgi:hypothetical protein